MAKPSFDFANAPGHLIRRAHQVSIAHFANELAAHDVTAVQFAMLNALIDTSGIDQITLAQRVAFDAATSGSVIARLETKGWIRRESDMIDKRRKLLWVTAEGKKVAAQMKRAASRVQERLLAPLNAMEQELLVSLLHKVVDGQ
jgi:DNA-binding MarR family transcriptional regulator